MAEDHKKIDLSYITDRERKDLEEAQELVYVDPMEKKQLRDIKETVESDRREFTEEECKRVLAKAADLHEAAEWFVQEEDSPVAPGAVLGMYHSLAEEVGLMKKKETNEKLQKMTYVHFSKAMQTLEESNISANIYRGNYEYDATNWDPRAAEAQTKNPDVDLQKVGDVGPYDNLN